MKGRLAAAGLVLWVSVGAGMALGLWWANRAGEAICDRLEHECGDAAMLRDDCLSGRRQDLLHYGVLALWREQSCVARAPADCLSVSACVAAAGPGG